MDFTSWFKKKIDCIGVVEIGNEYITTAIVTVAPQGRQCLTVINKHQTPITYSNPPSLKRYLQSVTQGIDASLKNITAPGAPIPDIWFCYLPSLITINTTHTINHTEDLPVTVTEKMIQGMVQQHTSAWLADHGTFTNSPGDKYSSVESVVMQVVLNGYPTEQYVKKRARTIGVSAYSSAISKQILDHLESTIANFTHGKKIKFSTSIFAQYQMLSELMPQQQHFILLDPSGEVCDLSVVHQGVLAAHVSIPLGTRALSRQDSGFSSDAISTLALYAEGKLSTTAKSSVENKIAPLKRTWNDLFTKALQQVSEHIFVPGTVMILGDDPLAAIFASWIQEEGFESFTLARRPLEVVTINRSIASSFCTEESKSQDLGFILNILFARRITG